MQSVWSYTLIFVAASHFVDIAVAQSETGMPQEVSLSEHFRQAREQFSPPSEQQLAEARAALLREANELRRYLRPNTANGRRWLAYLRWDALQQELRDQQAPEPSVLLESLRRLNRDEQGLELPPFRRASAALRRYVDLATVAGDANASDVYADQLQRLEGELEQLRSGAATPQLEYEMGHRLDFIAGLGQAPALIAAIRREFGAPNAYMSISAGLVQAAADEPIRRSDPFTDNILGTRIRGDGHTTGTTTARTLPSGDAAVIELVTKGHVTSQNLGRNGPAVIRSTGQTDFLATKRVELSDRVFRSAPARVSTTTSTDIHSISKAGGGIGSRLVSSQGWKRAQQTRHQVNEIAADHAADRIRRRIDEEVAERLRDARESYEEQYRRPLVRRGELPHDIRFASTNDDVMIDATQANRSQLAAATPPPPAPNGHDLVLRLHDSAVNNYSSVILSGATASETEAGQDRATFDVVLPEWMKNAWENNRSDQTPAAETDEPFKPWSMTFRESRPVTVDFDNGQVRLTIHVALLISGDERFDEGWDITGIFTPRLENDGIVLVRDDELDILPTGFDRTRPLPSDQVAVRSNLNRVLNERSAQGRGFPARIEFAPLEPTGSLDKIGPLAARELQSEDGWLTIAWSRN
jgi:hypothetical protein